MSVATSPYPHSTGKTDAAVLPSDEIKITKTTYQA